MKCVEGCCCIVRCILYSSPAHVNLNSAPISSSLITAVFGSSQMKREGSARETKAQKKVCSRWERHVQRARLAPTVPAHIAHLPLQFYFNMISISKSLLAALAFGRDKRTVKEGWKRRNEEENGKKAEQTLSFLSSYCH